MNKEFTRPDYGKIAKAYNKAYGSNYASNFVAQIDRGNLKCVGVEERIKELAYKGKVLKKEFVTIDYKKLAVSVSEKIGKPISTSYVRQVHCGDYKSSKILSAIEELL